MASGRQQIEAAFLPSNFKSVNQRPVKIMYVQWPHRALPRFSFPCRSLQHLKYWFHPRNWALPALGKDKKAQKLSHGCFDKCCNLLQTLVSKTIQTLFAYTDKLADFWHPQITSQCSEQKSMERMEPPQHFTTPPRRAHLQAHSSLQLVVCLVLSKSKCEHQHLLLTKTCQLKTSFTLPWHNFSHRQMLL